MGWPIQLNGSAIPSQPANLDLVFFLFHLFIFRFVHPYAVSLGVVLRGSPFYFFSFFLFFFPCECFTLSHHSFLLKCFLSITIPISSRYPRSDVPRCQPPLPTSTYTKTRHIILRANLSARSNTTPHTSIQNIRDLSWRMLADRRAAKTPMLRLKN